MAEHDVQEHINVMSLNVWGLPKYLTPYKPERMNAIAVALNDANYDIVCLQEVWDINDYELIKSHTSNVLPHSHYFHSGVTGSGLCMFSKWPIEDVMFFPWPLNGYMHMIHHGDWFGGKGVALARLNFKGLIISVYTAHLHARYNRNHDPYLAHRVVQAFDTSIFVRMTSESSHLSILAGDFNTEPGELCQKLLQNTANLEDAYNAQTCQFTCGTNECSRNSFSSPIELKSSPLGNRIDYIMYKANNGTEAEAVSYNLPLEERIPGTNYSYSDHEAVAAVIKVTLNQKNAPNNEKEIFNENASSEGDIKEAVEVCKKALQTVKTNTTFYLIYSVLICFIFLTFLLFTNFLSIYSKTFTLLMVLMSVLCCFTLLMGTLWHKIETNALLGAINRMQITLNRIKLKRNCQDKF